MAGIRLSKIEKETVITFNEAEATANIYSTSDVWIRKIRKIKGHRKFSIGYEVDVPKNWIKVSPPRKVSEKTREAARRNMAKLQSMRKTQGTNPRKTTKKTK